MASESRAMSSYHHGNLREALLERAALVIDAGGVEALTMRGLARDLEVSSAASARHFKSRLDLLSILAAEGYGQATAATLAAAQRAGDHPVLRLNAMGKAFVHWSLDNRALFQTISHPDVSRHADDRLQQALGEFASAINHSVRQAQKAGWRAQENPDMLFQYAIAAVRGVAYNLSDRLYVSVLGKAKKQTANKLIDLIVPIENC